ncbi:MAG TPA: RNA 2',3'-cyclic phosphodiesterase, partial [Anaerolineales bacterium]
MSLLRTFIAIEFPPVLQEAIYSRTAPIREAASSDSVRWVPRPNLHLTLKFLGDTSPANIQFLNQMLEIETAKFSRFQLSIGGLGAFPGTKRPRILWVGAQIPPELKALQYH